MSDKDGDRAKGLRAMREKKHKGASIKVDDLFKPKIVKMSDIGHAAVRIGNKVVTSTKKAKRK